MLAAKTVSEFKKSGYFVIPGVIDAVLNRRLGAFVGGLANGGAGSRRLLDEAWCAHLAGALRGNGKMNSLLPRNAVAVQCTLFDKSPTKNWLVALHQDLSIPVSRRVESLECSGWSEKEGQVYVQPPISVLEQLVAVRIHIDDCPVESGALRVVPGSHSEGRVDRERAEALRLKHGEIVVPVGRGGALVVRPLILHASSKATSLSQRRVLHFVFGPPRLRWGWSGGGRSNGSTAICRRYQLAQMEDGRRVVGSNHESISLATASGKSDCSQCPAGSSWREPRLK